MTTKACTVETTAAWEAALRRHLPHNVGVVGRLEDGAAHILLHLEGDGLPEWCHKPAAGYIPHAVAEVTEAGGVRFIPGSGLPVQQVPEQFLKE